MTVPGSTAQVAHILTSVEMGGAERVVLQLIPAMAQRGFTGRVICLRTDGALAGAFRDAGISVHVLPDAQHVGAAGLVLRLLSHLRTDRPTFVHTHNASPLLVGGVSRRLARVPCHLHTKHGAGGASTTIGRTAMRWAIGNLDALVAVSEATRQLAIEVDGAPPRIVNVLPNGIDLPGEPPVPPPPQWTAMTVGRLEPVKGHRHLIDAVSIVRSRFPTFRLAIVGDGSQRAALTAQAEALGVSEAVDFLGLRDDVAQLLERASIFVLPSLSEGISLTLLEAMAASRAVVATAVGGTPEVVVDGETAVLIPPASGDALARAILQLIEHPQRAREIGHAARGHVVANYSLDAMADAYTSPYQRVHPGHSR